MQSGPSSNTASIKCLARTLEDLTKNVTQALESMTSAVQSLSDTTTDAHPSSEQCACHSAASTASGASTASTPRKISKHRERDRPNKRLSNSGEKSASSALSVQTSVNNGANSVNLKDGAKTSRRSSKTKRSNKPSSKKREPSSRSPFSALSKVDSPVQSSRKEPKSSSRLSADLSQQLTVREPFPTATLSPTSSRFFNYDLARISSTPSVASEARSPSSSSPRRYPANSLSSVLPWISTRYPVMSPATTGSEFDAYACRLRGRSQSMSSLDMHKPLDLLVEEKLPVNDRVSFCSSMSQTLSRRSSAPAALSITDDFEQKQPIPNSEGIYLAKNNRVTLNIGGTVFTTTLNTITKHPDSMLGAMFSGRFTLETGSDGAVFIDRDPTHFRHILNYLRDGVEYLKECHVADEPSVHLNELIREARYYNLRPLVNYLETSRRKKKLSNRRELTQEKEYKFLTKIEEDDLQRVFTQYTANEGYDFEQCISSTTKRNGSLFHMIFSKKLSRAEIMLLDRLAGLRRGP